MNISKVEALKWFSFLSELPGEKHEISKKYEPIIGSVLRQIELSINNKFDNLIKEIPNIKNMKNRTIYVGDQEKFPKEIGRASCRERVCLYV